MANAYTNKLKKRMPAPGDFNWDDEWHDNEKIDDVVAGGLLSRNRVVLGGEIADGGGLNVDHALIVCVLAGVRYEIAAGSVVLAASSINYVYVDGNGTVGASPNPPAGNYIPLAVVDTDETSVVRIGDLRPMANDAAPAMDNIFINGDMAIDQENEGSAVSVSTATKYFLDMFLCHGANHGAVVDAQQVAGFGGFGMAAKLTVTTADTLASNEYGHGIKTFVEYKNCQVVADRYLAFAFKFKGNVTGTYSVALVSGDGSNSYVTTFAYNSADAVQVVPMMVPLPASKVVAGATGAGLAMYIGVAAIGAKATENVDQWQSGEFFSAAGAADWETTIGNYIAVTGLYGGADLIPAEFPFRANIDELLRCQRYYCKSYRQGVKPGVSWAGVRSTRVPSTGVYVSAPVSFPATMRSIPTVTLYSPTTGNSGFVRNESTSSDYAVSSVASIGDCGFSTIILNSSVNDTNSISYQYVANARM